TCEADGDKRPLGDVFPHRGEVEGLIWSEISKKVQAGVEESEEAEHAPETDEVRKLEELAERSDRESEDKKAQDPVTGGVLEKLDGIGAQIVVNGAREQFAKRLETKKEEGGLGPFTGKDCVHAEVPA